MVTNSSNPFGHGVTPDVQKASAPPSPPPEAEETQEDLGLVTVDVPEAGSLSDVAIGAPSNMELVDALDDNARAALTPEKEKSLIEHTKSMSFGFATKAAPMICHDSNCPFISKCPLKKNGISRPFLQDCPVEQAQIASWTKTFSLAAGVQDDLSAAFDHMLIDQIVFQMLLESRAAMQLAMDPEIEREFTTGYNPLGQPFTSREVSKAAEFYEKMVKTKMRLMRELLTTRRSKAEAAAKGYADPSRVAASLMSRAKRVKEAKIAADGSSSITEVEFDGPEPKEATVEIVMTPEVDEQSESEAASFERIEKEKDDYVSKNVSKPPTVFGE